MIIKITVFVSVSEFSMQPLWLVWIIKTADMTLVNHAMTQTHWDQLIWPSAQYPFFFSLLTEPQESNMSFMKHLPSQAFFFF